MNSIEHLSRIASKEVKIILGLMSGTSMDGLDLALCQVAGHGPSTTLQLLNFKTVSYSAGFKKQLQKIVSVERCSLQQICLMNTAIGDHFAQTILEVLKEWQVSPAEVDCIASHGQTVYHAPISKHQKPEYPNATLQIGDGDHIAQETGIITISDFRQKHTAAGGEGAPLVALVDELLFRGKEEFRLLLNIGGIANFTYLPPLNSGRKILTTDTGPGNTLLDQTARRRLDLAFDKNGRVAAKGEVDQNLLNALKSHTFFTLDLPKTTGPELFNWGYLQQALQESGTDNITSENLLASLVQFTVETIVEAIQDVHQSSAPLHIYISGGGMHNPVLLERLEKKLTEATLESFEKIGFNPDAKEAACFSILANEALSGDGFSINPLHQKQKVRLGKISLPD